MAAPGGIPGGGIPGGGIPGGGPPRPPAGYATPGAEICQGRRDFQGCGKSRDRDEAQTQGNFRPSPRDKGGGRAVLGPWEERRCRSCAGEAGEGRKRGAADLRAGLHHPGGWTSDAGDGASETL